MSIEANNNIYIFANLAQLNAAEKDLASKSGIIWGETFYTLSTLLRSVTGQGGKWATPFVQKAIAINALNNTCLRYFEGVKHHHSLQNEFLSTIMILRKNLISVERLEKNLAERGSLKEFDLLTIYKKYVEQLDELGLGDDGTKLELLIENVESIFGSKNIVMDGFDQIPPGVTALLDAVASKMPDTTIVMAGTEAGHYISGEEKWQLPCQIDLHTCRSAGNEARFICEDIAKRVKEGAPPESIGLVISKNSEFTKTLLLALDDIGLLPGTTTLPHEGRTDLIKEAISKASSLDILKERLEALADEMRKSFKEKIGLPEIALNLGQLNLLFEEIFQIENSCDIELNFDTIQEILVSNLANSGKTHIKTELLPFSLRWWEDDICSPLDTLYIPSASQGGLPPESSTSIFFQDTSFLPGNAPDYFDILFTQAESLRAKNILRLQRYLANTKKRVVLSYSRIGADEKEKFPANILLMLEHTEIDEESRLHPIQINDSIKKDILRRANFELEDNLRPKENSSSIINDVVIKSDIKERFNTSTYSASQLETYARCPYQYFLKKVMKIDPIDPPTPEIKPKDRGTIIHRVMELFYQNEIETVLKVFRKELAFECLVERIDEYVSRSIEEKTDLIKYIHPSLLKHFLKRAKQACVDAVKLEMDLIDDMKFPQLPAHTEWAFGKDNIRPLVLRGAPLEHDADIIGVIDRIDIDHTNKTFSVTDYKTGTTSAIINKAKDGKHLQLPLYIEATKKLLLKDLKPVGAFLLSMKTMKKMHGMALKESKAYYYPKMNNRLFVGDEEWDNVMDSALLAARTYINNIRNSKFSEDITGCKTFCDYKGICRYGKK